MFKEITGDIIEIAKEDPNQCVIVHGCNCHKVMGSGLAFHLKKLGLKFMLGIKNLKCQQWID